MQQLGHEVGILYVLEPLFDTQLLLPGESIDILPSLYKSSAQAGKASGDIVGRMTVLGLVLRELQRVATIGWCEGLVPMSE